MGESPFFRLGFELPDDCAKVLEVRGDMQSSLQAVKFGRYAPVCLCFMLASCASYVDRTQAALRAFQEGDFASAIAGFAEDGVTESEFLAGAEAGTAALVDGDWAGARRHFERAARASEAIEKRALAGTTALTETLGTWVLNDTAQTYQGEGFERVYLHCGLALTYLAERLLDDVFVEARLADRLLTAEEELYEVEYGAGGWGHLISAIAYELLGELDNAYIDYARMEAKGVGLEVAGPALVRIARSLNRTADLARWEESFGAAEVGSASDPELASIIVLAGVGLAPFKYETGIVLPTGSGLLKITGPAYRERSQPVEALVLEADDRRLATVVVEDVGMVVQKNLSDRLAWITARSVARGIAKRELTQQLEESYGLGGLIAGDLFTLFSERADLRSWLTLPNTWQAARLFVKPGRHTVRLGVSRTGGGGIAGKLEFGSFELEPGETMFVFARSLGERLFASTIGGRPISSTGARP